MSSIKCLLKTVFQKFKSKKSKVIALLVLAVLISSAILYCTNKLSETEKQNIERTISAISDIGEVQLDSASKIVSAEKEYNALSKKCQLRVKNRKDLTNARTTFDSLKAEETIKLIDKIGTVTLNNQEVITNAKDSYDKLSDRQKELVGNAEKLLSSVEELTNLKIKDVDDKISAIGKVTLESEDKIKKARDAYKGLTDSEKNEVTDYEVLVKAENDYEEMVINNCIELIDNIGKVTLKSKKQIDKAQNQYDSLTNDAKFKVTNYNKLKQAVEKYEVLEQAEIDKKKTLHNGDTFTTDKWQVTYKKANVSAKILPNDMSGYYHYYYANDDETFIDLVFKIKNVNTDILGIDNLVEGCKVEYNGATLTKSYGLYTSNGSDVDKVYSWDGLDALDSTTLHIAISMPRELQTNGKSVTVRLNIAGQDKIIKAR